MKIYREVGSLSIVNREDAEGYARPVYSIEVEEAVPIEDYRSMERTVDKLIKALAEAEPIKHGHWVNGFNSPLKCSSCGIVNRANEITLRTDFKFCPYCGAKMDGVKE